MGIADVFKTSGAEEGLGRAFLRSVAAQGGTRVRATADRRDLDTIDILESLGFANDPSQSHETALIDLWAQTD